MTDGKLEGRTATSNGKDGAMTDGKLEGRTATRTRRRLAAIATGLLALALAPATATADDAIAETRYASPTGTGAAPCTTQTSPCTLVDALAAADDKDTVRVAAGFHGTQAAPLTLPAPDEATEAITIVGEGPLPATRPVIFADGPLTLVNGGSVVADLFLLALGQTTDAIGALDLKAGAVAERVLARGNETGCSVRGGASGATIKNSVCFGADGFGLLVDGDQVPASASATVRNSTIFSRGDDAIFVRAGTTDGENASLTAVNTIAQTLAPPGTGAGQGFDVNARTTSLTVPASATLSNSNYDSVASTGLLTGNFATITAPGAAANQTAPPQFASTALNNEDVHQLPTSPTIDSGVNDGANGAFDVDGQPRIHGAVTDIGADEFVPAPPAAPGRTITGTPGNDTINGTPGDDVIICGAGDDVVNAGGGNDLIDCGDGNDRVNAGAGNDLVLGGRGNDRLDGGSGNDALRGQDGNDRLRGNSGDDQLSGGGGNDSLGGHAGADRLGGDSGRDRLGGGSGNDRLSGGDGNDRLSGSSGNDRLAGGKGRDRLNGGSGRDRLSGNSGGDRLVGTRGNDRIAGGSGNDRIAGGSGNDRLSGNSGRDRISGGSGRDRLSGGSGNDRLKGGSGNDRLSGGSGRDRLAGGPGRDRLRGGPGVDVERQ